METIVKKQAKYKGHIYHMRISFIYENDENKLEPSD
jgi:hypothetical protein